MALSQVLGPFKAKTESSAYAFSSSCLPQELTNGTKAEGAGYQS